MFPVKRHNFRVVDYRVFKDIPPGEAAIIKIKILIAMEIAMAIAIEIGKLPEIDFDHDFDTDTDTDSEHPWFENKSALIQPCCFVRLTPAPVVRLPETTSAGKDNGVRADP